MWVNNNKKKIWLLMFFFKYFMFSIKGLFQQYYQEHEGFVSE